MSHGLQNAAVQCGINIVFLVSFNKSRFVHKPSQKFCASSVGNSDAVGIGNVYINQDGLTQVP